MINKHNTKSNKNNVLTHNKLKKGCNLIANYNRKISIITNKLIYLKQIDPLVEIKRKALYRKIEIIN